MASKIGITALVVLILILGALYIFNQQGDEGDTASLPEQSEQNTMEDNSNETANELRIETTQEGEGDTAAQVGDVLTVHYTGTLQNGTKFDSSLDRNEPFDFQLGTGSVIEGWDRGLLGAKEGEKRRLFIPADLAYGSSSIGIIPANANLIFEVEVLDIQRPS